MRKLLGPQVERADHNRAGWEGLHDLDIGVVLRLFGRLRVALEIEKLGAVQANALGPALDAVLDLVGKLDIAVDVNRDAVPRFRAQGPRRESPCGCSCPPLRSRSRAQTAYRGWPSRWGSGCAPAPARGPSVASVLR